MLAYAKPPASTTDEDALDASVRFQFGGTAARYSLVDSGQEQQAGPACTSDILYIALGWRQAFPTETWWCSLYHQCPHCSEVRSFLSRADCMPPTRSSLTASNSHLHPIAPDTARPAGRAAGLSNDKPIRYIVPLLTRPRVVRPSPFHSFQPPGNRAHPTCVRTFLLVGRY